MLRLTSILVLGLSAYQPPAEPASVHHCILVLPPRQVARAPRLEVVYCRTSVDRCIDQVIAPGWLYVAGPVACD